MGRRARFTSYHACSGSTGRRSGGSSSGVVSDDLDEGLVARGVDEISWRRRHRYLTCVVGRRTGDIVWIREGRHAATLQAFSDELGSRAAPRSGPSRWTCRPPATSAMS